MNSKQQQIVAEARSWLKTPYHHQGDIKGVGVDCLMLLVRVYHACGLIPAIDPRPYPTDWHLHRSDERYLDGIRHYCVQVETPQPADIVMYQFGRCFSHAGIVLEWPIIVHAHITDGLVVLGEGDAGRLAGRERQFWRVRSI